MLGNAKDIDKEEWELQRNSDWPFQGPPFLGASIPSLCFFFLPEEQSGLWI